MLRTRELWVSVGSSNAIAILASGAILRAPRSTKKMKLYIGQAQLKGSFDAYCRKFNVLELLAEPQRLPKLPKLRQWRETAPDDFVFSVVLSPACLGGDEAAERSLSYALQVVEAVSAPWVVIRSGPQLRPGSSGEKVIGAVVSKIRDVLPTANLAWEPRGLWSGKALRRAAEQLGVVAVVDAREAEPSDVLYVRHRHIGVGTRTNSRQVEALALACVQSGEALVVVDGGSAAPLRQQLTELFEEFAEDDAELDDEDESIDDLDGDDPHPDEDEE